MPDTAAPSKPEAHGRRRLDPSELRNKTPKELLTNALKSGLSGAMSMTIQVTSLMWMRTTINSQYRYGGTIKDTLKRLYSEGGVRRFYRGYAPALIQGPISRFGETVSNSLFIAFMEKNDFTRNLPIPVKTFGASLTAGLFRVLLTPVDTIKTTLQVEGAGGMKILGNKYRAGGVPVFYHGAMATWAATLVGHYPWFVTYNTLEKYLPVYTDKPRKLLRSAFMGFISSAISDTCSNSIRVVKTTKQTNRDPITYQQAVKMVIEKDGLLGLFGRGLKMKILTNGVQGLMFAVLWRFFEEKLGVKRTKS